MLRQTHYIIALALCLATARANDVLQLRGDASIKGKILTEKPDQVIVDIGYTVLVVPRSEIVKMSGAGPASVVPADSEAPKVLQVKSTPEVLPPKSPEPAVGPRSALFQSGD